MAKKQRHSNEQLKRLEANGGSLEPAQGRSFQSGSFQDEGPAQSSMES